jgi:hypothetical protein
MASGVFTHFYSPFWDPGTLMVQRSNPVACRSNSCQPSVIGPNLGSSPTACQSSLMLCAQNKKRKKVVAHDDHYNCILQWDYFLVDWMLTYIPMFFFFCFRRIFATWRPKRKALANPTKGFLRFKRKNSPYHDQKNLDVASFRQCIPIGR